MTKMRMVLGVLTLGILASTAAHARTTAGDVTDRDSLKAFRQEGGHWKEGSIYLWIVSGSGIILFHATQSDLEGRLADVDRVDVNGVRFVHEMINGARENEEGMFLRYNFDDPTVEGDEETGSPKIGYAKGFPVPNSDQKLIVGSGIFLSDEGGE